MLLDIIPLESAIPPGAVLRGRLLGAAYAPCGRTIVCRPDLFQCYKLINRVAHRIVEIVVFLPRQQTDLRTLIMHRNSTVPIYPLYCRFILPPDTTSSYHLDELDKFPNVSVYAYQPGIQALLSNHYELTPSSNHRMAGNVYDELAKVLLDYHVLYQNDFPKNKKSSLIRHVKEQKPLIKAFVKVNPEESNAMRSAFDWESGQKAEELLFEEMKIPYDQFTVQDSLEYFGVENLWYDEITRLLLQSTTGILTPLHFSKYTNHLTQFNGLGVSVPKPVSKVYVEDGRDPQRDDEIFERIQHDLTYLIKLGTHDSIRVPTVPSTLDGNYEWGIITNRWGVHGVRAPNGKSYGPPPPAMWYVQPTERAWCGRLDKLTPQGAPDPLTYIEYPWTLLSTDVLYIA